MNELFETPYAVRKAPRRNMVQLDRNEGPLPPANWLDDMDLNPETVRAYPSAAGLEGQLAERLAVDPAQVLVTAGADDAIDRCCRLFLRGGGSLRYHSPTFEMLERYAWLAGGTLDAMDWRAGEFPGEQFMDWGQQPRLIAVVSPNNPTGLVVSRSQIQQLLAAARDIPVMLDHAYAEYADDDLTDLVASYDNLVVVRTLSKAWGLAGCRVGYAVGCAETITRLRAAGAPYPVSGPSLALAARALTDRTGEMSRHVSDVRRQRSALIGTCTDLGISAGPSQANFVLAELGERAPFVRDAAASLDVLIRDFSALGALRISVSNSAQDVERVQSVLRTILRPEAILFDMDGVLVDVSGSYHTCILETAQSFGVTVEAADITEVKTRGNANNDWEVTQTVLARNGVDVPLDAVIERFQSIYARTKQSETCMIRLETWRELAKRFRLAVVTGRPRAEAFEALERFGLGDEVGTVVSMDDAPPKPSPEPVRRALTDLGCTHAWMVGDTVDDIAAARAAGVVPIGVRGPHDPEGMILRREGAAIVMNEPNELLELLP